MKRFYAIATLTALLLLFSPAGAEELRGIKRIEDLKHAGGKVGSYRALVIGIDDYADTRIPDLETAVNDAKAMEEVLRTRYGFKTRLLLNREATLDAIRRAMREMATTATADDNLLIYYAGHGELEREFEGSEDGYWVPADAKADDELTYLDNVLVQKIMRGTGARHVLLISDSCYSGTLLGTARAIPREITDRYYLNLYNDRSRWGMTSGNKTPVSDRGTGGHSVFAYQLLKHLRKNDRPYLSTQEIYTQIAPVIANNSEQTPMCRPVLMTGDQGGEFIFLLASSSGFRFGHPHDVPTESKLTVEANVRGAKIEINGADYGQTPRTFTIREAGEYTVRVTREGYEPYQARVSLKPGEAETVSAILKKNAPVIEPEPQPVVPAPVVSGAPEPGDVIDGPFGMKFAWIPPGTFMMGSPDDEPGRDSDEDPQHRVTLSRGFYMQTTEVTQAQWKAVMGSNPSYFKDCGGDCPVEMVSWEAVQEFIQKLNRKEGGNNYRLPTEAEWEYAARAGTTTPFAFGSCLDTKYANYNGNYPLSGCPEGVYREKTIPVGSLGKSNAWGLYDMHGNVYEWCEDAWHDNYEGAPADGSAWVYKSQDAARVLRGGSWNYLARNCRSAYRNSHDPDLRDSDIGFRLVRASAQY